MIDLAELYTVRLIVWHLILIHCIYYFAEVKLCGFVIYDLTVYHMPLVFDFDNSINWNTWWSVLDHPTGLLNIYMYIPPTNEIRGEVYWSQQTVF